MSVFDWVQIVLYALVILIALAKPLGSFTALCVFNGETKFPESNPGAGGAFYLPPGTRRMRK